MDQPVGDALSPSILATLEPLIAQNRGARFEADIFATLYPNPRVFRSFEFATVDGGLDCTSTIDDEDAPSYSRRFCNLRDSVQTQKGNATSSISLVPFDVKSTAAQAPLAQTYLSSVAQNRHVAFYICISGADPRYVELIPNTHIPPQLPPDRSEANTDFQINTTKLPLVDYACNGSLNLWGSAHRMPLALLNEAVRRVRSCALGHGDYVNPHTGVRFYRWRPKVVHSLELFEPSQGSDLYNAYVGVMDICQAITASGHVAGGQPFPTTFDFVHLQPRLADFKLIMDSRQILVQYKVDGRTDRPYKQLRQVSVARRRQDGQLSFFFTPFERFDFLFYEFNFKSGHTWIPYIFCIPERAIPDDWYTSEDERKDFDIDEFRPYGVVKDNGGQWISKFVHSLLAQDDQYFPKRDLLLRPNMYTSSTSKAVLENIRSWRTIGTDPTTSLLVDDDELQIMASLHRDIYHTVMMECAILGRGMVLALPPRCPMGDFAYCAYQWSSKEQMSYMHSRTPPFTLVQASPETPIVCFYAYAKQPESNSQGPFLSAPQLRRINSCRQPHRLLVFDPTRPDALRLPGPLYVVPTEDLSLEKEQSDTYRDILSIDKNIEHSKFAPRPPLLSQMLHSGHAISDYLMSTSGAAIFDIERHRKWQALHQILQDMSDQQHMTFPTSRPYSQRVPKDYRTSVHEMNQRLLAEIKR